MTLGVAISKQKQVIFLFNTEQDAQTAQTIWPLKFRNMNLKEYIALEQSFRFQFWNFNKGGYTYTYAVKSSQAELQSELEWRHIQQKFEVMKDATNRKKAIQLLVFTGILFL